MATGLGAAFQKIREAFADTKPTVEPTAPSAAKLLDEAEAEITRKAREALAEIDEVTSRFGALEREAAALRPHIELWERRCATAKTDGLRASAERSLFDAQGRLEVKEHELAEARPEAEAALRLMEEVGFKRDEALSETQRLRIEAASAEVRLKLAKARDAWATGNSPQKLIDAAQDQVYRTAGEAEVREELAGISSKQ